MSQNAIAVIAGKGGRPAGALTAIEAPSPGLGRHHFHFLRGLIEGLEPSAMWTRYMAFTGVAYDERLHLSRVKRLTKRLSSGSSRHGPTADAIARSALHPGRLLPPSPIALPSSADSSARPRPSEPPEQAPLTLPTLDDWIDERVRAMRADGNADFEPDFYSEREWLGLYEEEFGLDQPPLPMPATALVPASPGGQAALAELTEVSPPAATASKRAARAAVGPQPALADQLDALSELERLLVRQPAAKDPCSAWLTDGLAKRLQTAGVITLVDLAQFINLRGWRWFRGIEGIGAVLARRLTKWVAPLAEGFGVEMKPTALMPAGQLRLLRGSATRLVDPESIRRFGLVPLARLAVPPELDGRRGEFRVLGANVLGANTDLQAIEKWLSRYRESPRTFDAYARAVERFYLFCLLRRRKPLSSVREEDLIAYRQFLSKPDEDWIQRSRSADRASDEWRPLRGPLSPASQRHSFTILAAMFAGLDEAGYLRANPARGVVPKMRLPPARLDKRRSFTEAQWSLLMLTIAAMKDEPGLRRGQLILELGATTGLRLIELATTRMRDLRREWMDGQLVWMLDVQGKGNRARRVIVYDDVKALIDQHHQDMDAAGTSFDGRTKTMRTLLTREDATAHTEESVDQGMRPLIGALRLRPARWVTDEDGVPKVDREGRGLADRFGALDPSALYQSLRRLFTRAARMAAMAGDLVEQADALAFEQASTHWLRHFFANNMAADNVLPAAMQKVLGHADLKTTSIYVNAEERLMVAELSKVRRRR